MTKRADAARQTAQSVADTLFQTEAAVDAALSQIAAFAQGLPAASRVAGFAATRGQDIYDQLAQAMVAQSQARARIVEVHGLLADLKDDSIMRTMTIGGGTKDSDPKPRPMASTGLALVSAVG